MICREEAERKAKRVLRLDIGTFPRLGNGHYDADANAYVFAIDMAVPRVGGEESEYDIEIDPPRPIGQIVINARTGEARYTPVSVLKARVQHLQDAE